MTIRRAVVALLAVAAVAAACAPPKEPPPQPPPPLPPLNFPCSAGSGSTVSGNDPLRTGWYPDQPGLNPSAGGACAFGQQWQSPVNGQVYAAPLVDPGGGSSGQDVLVVATETNNIYGFDAGSGAQLWHKGPGSGFGTAWNPDDLDPNCNDITPSIGITSTPAIDNSTHTAYFFAKEYVSGSSGAVQYKAHAIDIATGNEKPNFPVVIQGPADNFPTVSFDPKMHLQRPGLLLMGGVVYAAFGGHCDIPPYRGWVTGVNATSGAITTLWTDEATPNPPTPQVGKPGGGIWHSGGRLVSDTPGDILLVSGNGIVPPTALPGSAPPPTLGESAIRLHVTPATGDLVATDFFSPCNAQALSDRDQDIGSGAPLVLPNDPFGTPNHPNLVVVVGKEGPVYLLDQDDFGGYRQGSAGTCPEGPSAGDKIVSKLPAVPGAFGVWATPAIWPGEGGNIYFPRPTFPQFGVSGHLNAIRIVDDGNGNPVMSFAGMSQDTFGYASSSAIITSTGTQTGSGLVWIVFFPDSSGVGAELRAYDTTPVNGTMTLRGQWPVGQGNKFTTPTVHDGHMYVGARDGNVRAFGVLAQTASAQPRTRSSATGASDAPDAEG